MPTPYATAPNFVYILTYEVNSKLSNVGVYTSYDKAEEKMNTLVTDMPYAWKKENFGLDVITLE